MFNRPLDLRKLRRQRDGDVQNVPNEKLQKGQNEIQTAAWHMIDRFESQ